MDLNSTMSTYSAKSRSELLFEERYRWLAQIDGDKHSKAHASEVKRTASVLRKAQKTFDILLDYKELEALRIAVEVLDGLGKELDRVSSKARKTKKTRIDDARVEREELAKNFALRRWGNDTDAMLLEAKQLAEFVDNGGVSGAFAWVCSRHGVKHATKYRRSAEYGPSLWSLLNPSTSWHQLEVGEILLCAAEYLCSLQDASRIPSRKDDDNWVTGLDDFEAWTTRQVDA